MDEVSVGLCMQWVGGGGYKCSAAVGVYGRALVLRSFCVFSDIIYKSPNRHVFRHTLIFCSVDRPTLGLGGSIERAEFVVLSLGNIVDLRTL